MTNDYARIERAIRFLDDHPGASLEDVARDAGLSPFHFHRLFSRWAGVSPKRFQQFQHVVGARRLLREGRSVLDATYSAGLTSSGRLHDLMVTVDAVTPGEYKALGAGLVIRWGVHEGPFGPLLLGVTERGICVLRFVDGRGERAVLAESKRQWPGATWVEDVKGTARLARSAFAGIDTLRPSASAPLRLFLKGTNFQLKVWEALLRIPEGGVATYQDVAESVGTSGAVRATASAIAANPVLHLIPCHRVIRKTGAFGEYAGGETRKRAMLGWERARSGAA
ncbi:MAG TPA: methylated-DNA--[protein]-cysteine S-methyltransferase [Gemmatimonadales bacterium]|nr:methylated-DNA--[protein]-cysteine S-methyltransferase [Gemmatimonadales bacterium]